MNFVRQNDPRLENSEEILYECTCTELALCREYDIENTFLLQYDALLDERFRKLFASAGEKTELGLWLEIVEPLVTAVGLPWRGRPGWKWDWHVVPGFSMAYQPEQRKKLIDECMCKFREVYGYYPKTVGSWLIDTVTARYLAEKYEISALALCRDQVNTDAYTLVGGYFNQAYYPSKRNIFTPAQTKQMQIDVPVFRLLGPDPVHNYDNERYLYGENNRLLKPGEKYKGCYTMEPVWGCGAEPTVVDWFYDCYFQQENLGFSYIQLGQENSFGYANFISNLRMQLDKAKKLKDVRFMKMRDTGEVFKKTYRGITPATCLCALKDWNRGDEVQSIYYDCARYTANLFRDRDRIFLRCLYLFDETVSEHYLDRACETWDAEYENLPVIDTLRGSDTAGMTFQGAAGKFNVTCKDGDRLSVHWANGKAEFMPDSIMIYATECTFLFSGPADMQLEGHAVLCNYKGIRYKLLCEGLVEGIAGGCVFKPQHGYIRLYFE